MSRKVPGPCRPHISLRNAIYNILATNTDERKIQKKRVQEAPLEGWESVLNTCFPYHVHFEPQSAVVLIPEWHSSFIASSSVLTAGDGREERRFDLFRSSIILFYFPRRSIFVATFWSIALDTSATIHFYLRSDATGRWDSSPFPLTSLFSPTLSVLFLFWFVQLFAILFPFVEIIADVEASLVNGRCVLSNRVLDKILPGKVVWRV